MLEFIDKFKSPYYATDFFASVVLLGLFAFFLMYLMRRKFVIISTLITYVCYIVSRFFNLGSVMYLSLAFMIASAVIFVMTNDSEYRYYILNNVRSRKKRMKDATLSKEELYKMIAETTKSLSRTKTGAIMTFEKTTNLNDIIKNGTILNAPVCQELLMTIFYPGTRLHDGAVVIRGDTILAASVYYTPTTRALTGKYGSRHRAAFGISEISDSVTIVVSEETGRISLAYKGRLESCTYDSFLNDFVELMNDNEE